MEKTILDMLTQDSVSVKRQDEANQIWRRAYINNLQGREQVENEIEEPYKSQILNAWGDKPTVVDG